MEFCISLNCVLLLVLASAFAILGLILYPSLFGAKKNADGSIKKGFISLWFGRIKSLFTGKAKVKVDWDYDADVKKED